jgi:hypothetical protein
MTIETKYKVGDGVWFNTLGITYKAKVMEVRIRIFSDNDIIINYSLERNGYYHERNEDELFPSKEELLKSL